MSEIYVAASQLKAKAEDLRSQNAQLKEKLNQLEQTEQSLSAMWEGDAKEAFRSAFQRDATQIHNFYSAMEQYAAAMENAAVRYSEVENRNVDLINTRRY